MATVRIALAHLPYPKSPEASVTRAVDAIAEAGRAGALVVAFPECYVPGYRTTAHPALPPTAAFLDDAARQVAEAARRAGVAVALGTERIVDRHHRITTLVVDRDGTVRPFHDKLQLDPSEEPMWRAGDTRHVYTVGSLTFGLAICHEGWRYPETVRWAARRGAQLVFVPHFHEAEPGTYRPTTFLEAGNTFHEKALVCRAAENTIWIAAVNYAGEGAPTTSAVIRPDATVLSWQRYGEAGLHLADLDLSLATGLLASRCRAY
ncbi:MAG: carbon-nitrogen hydrolase family protein [Vicinamibacterales bacterium]